MFIGCCLTSWFSKKQTALVILTTKAEYLSTKKAYQQALWMKQTLVDYDIKLYDIPILCDNKGTIDLSKNPVQHNRTKQSEIRYNFLWDNVQKGNISIEKVSSEYQNEEMEEKMKKLRRSDSIGRGLEFKGLFGVLLVDNVEEQRLRRRYLNDSSLRSKERMSALTSSDASFSMEMFPFGHFPKGNADVSSGCLKGVSGSSGGKRFAISMVEEALLSEKEEV
ncbi:hypothetical protein Tco_0087146 [Tanacetum coccineum]